MGDLQGLVAYGIIIATVFFIIIVLLVIPPKEDPNKNCVENFSRQPTNFQMFNYFPKTHVKVEVIETSTPGSVAISRSELAKPLLKAIQPLKTEGLNKEQVSKYLKPGNILKFSILNPDGTSQHYSDYVVNTRDNERIKNLHIGMITTRFMNDTDSLRMSTTAGNAVSGSAWLIIHNTTAIPLILNNGEIRVEPHSTLRYLGYLNQGVTLGTYFKDSTGLYPDFQYLKPYTDLYYGIISDLQQPLNGCRQFGDFNDQCDYGDTLWPLNEGIY